MNEFEKLLLEVQQLNEKKEFKKIIELLPDSVLEKNNSADLYAEKAIAYYKLNNIELSDETIAKALIINPKHAKANNYMGVFCSNKKDDQKAIEFYKKAIEADPLYSVAYNNIGIVYSRQKLYDKAIESYEKAIELDLNYLPPYQGLADVYSEQELYDKAIETYHKAINIAPKNATFLNGLGIVYYKKKLYDKAIEYYNIAIEFNPNEDSNYYNLALAYFEKKEYQKALVNYKKYLELDTSTTSNFVLYANSRIIEIKKFLENEKYKNISELVNKIKELLIFKDKSITHYTGLSAAKALILENSKFRLSEGAFLNDTSEGRELYRHLSIPISKKLLETESILFAQKPFIGSFVTETKHDDLTLWRMYGKEEKEEARGCAITIDMESLLKDIKDTLTSDTVITDSTISDSARIDEEFTFYRVAYRKLGDEVKFIIPGEEGKELTLNAHMVELSNKVKEFTTTKEDEKYENKDLIERLNEIAYLFKSIEYQHENEIRLVIKGIGFNKKIEVNPPKVYIELVPIRSLINKITLGPKVDRAEELAAAFYYSLEEDGFKPCIHISHLPFK